MRKVGILGGGQLARMLAESALRMGLRPIVYSEEAKCPAADVAAEVVVGKPSQTKKLKAFLKNLEHVAFENEFIDCSELAKSGSPKKFLPALGTIELLQDKLTQKKLFKNLGLPTSPFVEVIEKSDIQKAMAALGGDIVLKWSRQGYDGKGVKVVTPKDLRAGEEFWSAAHKRKIPVYAEKRIDFTRELAMMGVRSVNGEFAHYPLVISEQRDGICKLVTGPATSLGVPKKLEEQAKDCVRKIGAETSLIGAYGVEMFETREGSILINEIAPRVHNSGHYTQNACAVSQFENHWRALLGLPLHHPTHTPLFAMLNLLGPPGVTVKAAKIQLPVAGPHSELHWYGKEEIRPGRKLGHFNGIAHSPESLSALLKELKVCEEEWVKGLSAK